MLCRSSRALLRSHIHRLYSTSPEPYSNFQKLRAYPFAFDEEVAKSYLGPFAAPLCNHRILSSVIARFFPGLFGIQPIQPTRIVPVYFPAWIIDAEIEATATADSEDGKEQSLKVQLRDGYLPGSSFEVLSSVPLWSSAADAVNEPQPWSEHLKHQFSREVTCLPYTVYPLTGLKALSRSKTTLPSLQGEVECIWGSIKPNLAVFRPVLIPVYLAQYQHTEPDETAPRLYTLFMDASSSTSPVRAYRQPSSLRDSYDILIDEFVKSTGLLSSPDSKVICFREEGTFATVSGAVMGVTQEIVQAIRDSISSKMFDPETIQKIANASVAAADDDPRIQEYDLDDKDKVDEWMKASANLATIQQIANMISSGSAKAIVSFGDMSTKKPEEALEVTRKQLQKKKDESEPEWWKDYVEQQQQQEK